jgi:CHY zinc finger
MADDEAFMQDDIDMADSDDDLDDDEDDDEDDGEDMNEEAAPQPEPQEEDIALVRRRAIQGIMRDNTISDQEKRMRIQNLMSGGRTEVAPPPTSVLPTPEGQNNACVHYERNCNLIAPCCDRAFGCRICHDELSPPGHPPMNRFMIREVVCKLCSTRQAAS